MKISVVDGNYCVGCYCHQDKFLILKKWCYDEFGDAWGVAQSDKLDRFYGGARIFEFNKLYHAQWFMLKWNEN